MKTAKAEGKRPYKDGLDILSHRIFQHYMQWNNCFVIMVEKCNITLISLENGIGMTGVLVNLARKPAKKVLLNTNAWFIWKLALDSVTRAMNVPLEILRNQIMDKLSWRISVWLIRIDNNLLTHNQIKL